MITVNNIRQLNKVSKPIMGRSYTPLQAMAFERQGHWVFWQNQVLMGQNHVGYLINQLYQGLEVDVPLQFV